MTDRGRLDRHEGTDVEVAPMFEPDVINVMREALDASWSALAFAHFADETEMLVTREKLANQILEGAAGGERRVPVLSGRALGALEPRRAAGSGGRPPGGQPWRVLRYVS